MIRGKTIILLACCASVCWGAWPTYHGGADLRGVSDAELPDKPELLWRYNAGGAIYSTPVSDGERIFFSGKKGAITAIDLKGSKLWEKSFTLKNSAGDEVPVRFDAPLACGHGLVFAGTRRGMLYALDAKTGATRWRYNTGGVLVGSPNLIKIDREDARTQGKGNLGDLAPLRSKLVVVDQSDGALHCLEVEAGELDWKTEGVERCDGSPGIGNGRIVFGSCAAALHVYGVNGKHLKDVEVGGDGQLAGGVALAGKRAFAGTRDGSLLCVDLEKGDVVWSSDESKEQAFSTPAATSNRVVYSSDDGFVYAVDRAEGKLVWKFDTGGLPTSPVVAKDKVVVSADGILYLLELADGRQLWSQEVSDEISSPGLIGGMIVVGADDGTVSAFGKKM
ncbi:MAG: PQQ-binding-like beta-propeller repeat protein [Verrucomicrobiota bacterium]|nr:PQQ-binding-like beta-propeller repeat protein [Verrucomicrobiota bacterium]